MDEPCGCKDELETADTTTDTLTDNTQATQKTRV